MSLVVENWAKMEQIGAKMSENGAKMSENGAFWGKMMMMKQQWGEMDEKWIWEWGDVGRWKDGKGQDTRGWRV
jgi:hypothetical protein